MKSSNIALVVRFENNVPQLVEVLSDEREISLLAAGEPLDILYAHREQERKDEEEFGDYVEKLLSQPCVRPEIQEHGVKWFCSKIKIEQFKRSEAEAASIIAKFAFEAFAQEPDREEFILSGPKSQIQVRVFIQHDASMGNNRAIA